MDQNIDLKDRVEREYAAHTDRDILTENLRVKQRFHHLNSYPSRKRIRETMESACALTRGAVVLDYGCGKCANALEYLRNGAKQVFGIDISPVYIQISNETIKRAGFSTAQYDFRVMDAHKLIFDDNMFDLVIGRAILHHLDVGVALLEVHRVLKPGGRALFFEPLADNPLLKLFRRLTPNARTIDESPFSGRQIRRMTDEKLWTSDLTYCGLAEAPIAMLTSLIMPRCPENILLNFADQFEKWTHKKRILLSWNQYVLFDLIKK